MFPSIHNFFFNQISSHLSLTQLLFNSPALRAIAQQQIITAINILWTADYPTSDELKLLAPLKLFDTLLLKRIYVFCSINLHFTLNFDLKITGGYSPIIQHIPNLSKSDLNNLRAKRILFLDQVSTEDGSFLRPYQILNNNKWTGRTPEWFNKLLSTTWSTSSRKFITPMPTPPIQRLLRNSPQIRDSPSFNPHNEWVITWDASSSDIIYGKSITQTNHPGSQSVTQIQHYIHTYVETFSPSHSTNTNASTPRRMTLFIRPCKGYSCHVYNVSNPSICTLYIATLNLLTIKLYRPLHIPAHITAPKRMWKFPTLHHHTLRTIAYNDYQRSQHSNSFLTPIIPVPRENLPNTLTIYNNNPVLNPLSPLYLKNLVVGFDKVIDRLLFLAHQFINSTDLSFYTDGSLFQEGPHRSLMGFAWIEITTSSNSTPFQGTTMFQPSSTTAETFAVLITLIVSPSNTCINIFTDSLNTIHNYEKFSNGSLSTRQKLKFTTYPVWSLILRLIELKHLVVTFKKVKSHSGDIFNDQADLLSKEATILSPIFISPKSDPSALMTVMFDYLGPLYGNIRKWSQRACHAHLAASNLHNKPQRHLLQLMDIYPIDWSSTSNWLRKNNDNGAPCSFHNDKTTGHKIKLYAHLLPTADIQQRNYPRLYPAHPILCSECTVQVYNNSHIGYCPAHLRELNDSLRTAANYLISLITSSPNAPPSTRDVISSIERSSLFSPVSDMYHPSYLLLHQLVPEELPSVVSLHIRSRKATMEIVEIFIQYFYTQITRKFWRIHSTSFHSWEKSRRITKRKKDLIRSLTAPLDQHVILRT
ncbi:ribonuclease H-like domain-containing protein [Rhizophagus clarus]|uniref:Ribonuclease H-like domain-containing protein n=1 Tax=Rhizophagus clarus TaxID=94130 RepID=A0A8H3QCB6_9GLOM|nr:ribonuclease H-like domain-containing protein [Rhizophagus clarus]